MGLTSNYAKLAAIAPGKRHGPKRKRGRKARPPPEKRVYKTTLPAGVDAAPPAPGVIRYYLEIPRNKYQQAIAAGCRFDGRNWFIDNPNLPDFATWKPRRDTGPIHPTIRAHQKLCRQRQATEQAGE